MSMIPVPQGDVVSLVVGQDALARVVVFSSHGGGSGGGGGAWGGITGTLSDQTDLQNALDLKAPLESPTLTGTPAAPTAAGGTSTTQIATTAFAAGEITTHAGAADPHGDRSFATSAVSTHAALTTVHGISAFGATLVDDADASTARTTLGLGTAATSATGDFAAASHAHAASAITSGTLAHERGGLEADVSAYSGLLKIAAGATSAVTVTAAGEALLDDADASAQRTTLGLGTAATTASTDYATAAQGTDDRTASGLRTASTVVAISSATAPTSGQTLVATSSTAATWQTPAVGSPGGSTTQLQYNNAGSFGGMAGTAWDDTNRSLVVTGATVTTSKPILDLSQTWNNAAVTFTGVKVNITNTASAAASQVADFQIDGNTLVSIQKGGQIRSRNGTSVAFLYMRFPDFFASPMFGLTKADNETSYAFLVDTYTGIGNVRIGSTGAYTWANAGTFTANPTLDLAMFRDAAGVLAQRNGTNAQTSRIYGTYTDASNYERIAIKASPVAGWMQVAAETAGTGTDNIGIALTPAGTGAISAQVPDSTAAGGNARGTYSVDLQRHRDAADEVASGSYSVIGGGFGNKASGTFSFTAGGDSNVVTGTHSTVVGGARNSVTANTSVISGGSDNVITAAEAVIAGGVSNTVSGYGAAILGGWSNTASGDYSWIPGGFQANTRGLVASYAYASGARSAQGDAQVIGQPVRQTTSSTSIAYLTTDAAAVSATNCMILPINSGCQFEGRLTAVHAAGAAAGGWKIEGIARRGASGDATVVDVVVTAFTADAAIGAPTITVAANAGGAGAGGIVIAVTPANTTATYWVGKLELIQGA